MIVVEEKNRAESRRDNVGFQSRGLSRVVAWIGYGVVILGSAFIGGLVAITLFSTTPGEAGEWVHEFVMSPGMAALVALIAAALAFWGISKQVQVARDSLLHQQDSARASSWWARYEWTTGRAMPATEGAVTLPLPISIATMQGLAEDATSDLQKTACAHVLDALTPRMGTTEAESPSEGAEDPGRTDPATFEALLSYVTSSRGTSAASSAAEAAVYEQQVLAALSSVDPDVQAFRNPTGDMGADAIVEVAGRRVLILVKRTRHASRSSFIVGEAVRRLRQMLGGSDPILVVTPYAPESTPSLEEKYRAVIVSWSGPDDNAELRSGLLRASSM